MSDKVSPRNGTITFPCGAVYECDHDRIAERFKGQRRVRLLVLDTANRERPKPPKHPDGEVASCLFCPARRYRREQRLMHDGPDPFAYRLGVRCSGVLTRREVGGG